MFEDSRTKVFTINATNADAASYAVLKALAASAGAFYYEPQTFTETAMSTNSTLKHTFAFRNTKGVLSLSKPFKSADIRNGGYSAYSARVEQVSYIGYNATSGSLDVTNNTYYSFRIVLDHTFGMLNNSPLMLTIPYKSDSTTTQREVASGLAVAATSVLDRQPYKCIKVERVNSGDVANALGTATASVVNGGNTIVFSEDMTALVVAGTVLRLGGLGATNKTFPCYVVTGHDSGAGAARIYTLDQKYQGTTAAALAANLIESVTEGDWGIKLTGISVTDANFDPINDEPFVVSFSIQLGPAFETATVTYTTKPYIGTGTYQLVASQEARSQFENKTREVSAYPRTSYNIDAIAGNTYNIFAFEVLDTEFVDPTSGIRPVSKVRYELAVLVGLTEAFHTVLGFGS
jgi:hypothetical protein